MVSRLNSQQGSMKYLLLLVKRGRYKPLHMKMLYEEFPDEAFQSQMLTFDSVWRIVVTRRVHRSFASFSVQLHLPLEAFQKQSVVPALVVLTCSCRSSL